MFLDGFRGMETESISEVLYFGTRRPFYHERLWRRSTNFGHGHYRYVHMRSQLLVVEVRSRSKQLFWGTLSFPFVVLNYLRTEAPPFWCKWKCCTEPFEHVRPKVSYIFWGLKFGSRKLLVCCCCFKYYFFFFFLFVRFVTFRRVLDAEMKE